MPDNGDTYHLHDINDYLIIYQHFGYLQKNYKFKVREDSKVLPSIYWVPMLPKTLTKAGFIIASPMLLLIVTY